MHPMTRYGLCLDIAILCAGFYDLMHHLGIGTIGGGVLCLNCEHYWVVVTSYVVIDRPFAD